MGKVLETIVFLTLGSFGTLGPKLSHGTSKKFADVRTHLRKVFDTTCLQSQTVELSLFICFLPNKQDTKKSTHSG